MWLLKTVRAYDVVAPTEPDNVKQTRPPLETLYDRDDLDLSCLFSDQDLAECNIFWTDVVLNAASESYSGVHRDIEGRH